MAWPEVMTKKPKDMSEADMIAYHAIIKASTSEYSNMTPEMVYATLLQDAMMLLHEIHKPQEVA